MHFGLFVIRQQIFLRDMVNESNIGCCNVAALVIVRLLIRCVRTYQHHLETGIIKSFDQVELVFNPLYSCYAQHEIWVCRDGQIAPE